MQSSVFNVADFGAIGDGRTLNTSAIQKAVDACAAKGGGRVLVPAGTFVSGPVFLKSNIEFHLGAGATLRGSRNMDDYPDLDVSGQEHGDTAWRASLLTQPRIVNRAELRYETTWRASLLTGHHLKNVAITGQGTLDGAGDVWWQAVNEQLEARIKAAAKKNSESEQSILKRPVLILFYDCERVTIDGIKAVNSPAYVILPILCRNLTINNVTIKNPCKAPNTDGIDPTSCRNVWITGCHIDTGDDGITLKTLPDYVMDESGHAIPLPRIPCENVVIANCVIEHAHSGACLGAEVQGGIRNVTVSNCVFDGTRAGVRIWRYPWPGGFVENVRMDNIVMRHVEWAIYLSADWPVNAIMNAPGRDDTPVFRNMHFSNITATGARIACEVFGLPKMPVRDISFSNINVSADAGFKIRDAEGILLDNIAVESQGPALLAQDTRGLEVRHLKAPAPPAGLPVIQLARVQDAWIHGCPAAPGTAVFLGLAGDGNRDINLEANRLANAAQAQAAVNPAPDWFTGTTAYTGTLMRRKSGDRNPWLPVTAAALATLRSEWPPEQIDRIIAVAHVEPGSRSGADAAPEGDRRKVYIIQADEVEEKLVIRDDGALLKKISDPNFTAWNYR